MDKLTSTESATITITRNTGNWGALSDITIYANDEKVASLSIANRTKITVKPGTYNFRAQMMGGYKSAELTLEMVNGETADIDISTVSIGQYFLPFMLLFILFNVLGIVLGGVAINIVRLVVSVIGIFVGISLFSQKSRFFILT